MCNSVFDVIMLQCVILILTIMYSFDLNKNNTNKKSLKMSTHSPCIVMYAKRMYFKRLYASVL